MNKKLFKNKKGQYLSPWWFIMALVIVVFVWGGASIYFGSEVNIKQLEANIFYEKITDCLVDNGEVIESFTNEGFDVYSECNLDREVIGEGDFYFRIRLLQENGGSVKEVRGGDSGLQQTCSILRDVDSSKNNPGCFVGKENYGSMALEITTASNQKGSGFLI